MRCASERYSDNGAVGEDIVGAEAPSDDTQTPLGCSVHRLLEIVLFVLLRNANLPTGSHYLVRTALILLPH